MLPPVMKTDSQQPVRPNAPVGSRRAPLRVVLVLAISLIASFASAQLRVVVSIEPYREAVERLIGDLGTVDVLLPPGASPHAFDPTPRDVVRLSDADLVVVNGVADDWTLELVDALGADAPPVFVALDVFGDDDLMEGGHDHDHAHGEHHDGEHHDGEHHDGEHDHGDHGGIAHACGHFDDDPIFVETGGAIPDDHTRYSIGLDEGTASVVLDWDAEGEVSFFLGTELPLALMDEGGANVASEDSMVVGEACEPMALVTAFHLEPGTYTLALGPATDVEMVDLVWERTGPHGHEDEHHDEEHHDEEQHHHAEEHEHDHGDVNAHVWLDPVRMGRIVADLAERIAELAPERADDVRAAGDAYLAELDALDAELTATLAPFAGAPFVPFHDAWPYFAERYGLDLVLEVEPFPGREPSARYLADAVTTLREVGARAIFTETQLDDRPARVLADEAGVTLGILDPLGGVPGREGYLALQRYNAAAIAEALAGEPGMR